MTKGIVGEIVDSLSGTDNTEPYVADKAENTNSDNINAGFSTLIYEVSKSSPEKVEGKTVDEVISSLLAEAEASGDPEALARLDECVEISDANGLGDMIISDVSWDDTGKYDAMDAMTVKSSDGDVYVVYKGTEDRGWGPNAQSTFGYGSSDIQRKALEYFDQSVEAHYDGSGKLEVSGHSQGGNNALYVTMMSEHGEKINRTISMDGPGFNDQIIEDMKNQFGEEYYEAQRQKLYGIHGYNDPVHEFGENTDLIPNENIAHVMTYSDNIVDYIVDSHDIFSHMTGGKLNVQTEEVGELRELGQKINAQINALPKEERYEIAVLMMNVVETITGGEEGDLSSEDLETLKILIPLLLNAGADYLEDNKLLALIAAAIITAPITIIVLSVALSLTITLAVNLVAVNFIIDKIIMLIEENKELIENIKEVALNCWNAVKEFVGVIGEFLHQNFNAGAKYVSNNPYFRVDTAKMREYANRLAAVNSRLRILDGDLNGLYSQVGFFDLLTILNANLVTGGSGTLNRVINYLNDSAQIIDNAESKASGYVGG